VGRHPVSVSFNILHMHGLFALDLVEREGATREACSGNLECKTGTIPAFALGPRKTKQNLCRDGRSQDLPVTDF